MTSIRPETSPKPSRTPSMLPALAERARSSPVPSTVEAVQSTPASVLGEVVDQADDSEPRVRPSSRSTSTFAWPSGREP